MPGTARHGKGAKERLLLDVGCEDRPERRGGRLHVAYAHSVFYYPDRLLASPAPPGFSPLVWNLWRWRWFHCAYGSVAFHYRCLAHVFANRMPFIHDEITTILALGWFWNICDVNLWILVCVSISGLSNNRQFTVQILTLNCCLRASVKSAGLTKRGKKGQSFVVFIVVIGFKSPHRLSF